MTLTAGPTRSATGWTVDTSTFRARLALVRNQMEWNIKEAARECGLTGATWRLWELEGALPRDIVTVSKKISTRTGCDFLWLVHGPDQGGGNLPPGSSEPTPQPARAPLAPHVVVTVGDPQPDPQNARPPRAVRAVRTHPRRRPSLEVV